MATLTVTSLINKPGIGFVTFKQDKDTYEDYTLAKDLMDRSKSIWLHNKDVKLVEDIEGQSFTIQTSDTQQLKFEVSE